MFAPLQRLARLPQVGSGARVVILEICVDDAAGLASAVAGGANRIELCASLDCGGLTPSSGQMRQAAGAPIPVIALIRPRAGDFRYRADEWAVMADDIAAAAAAGLAGVAIGACLDDGRIDEPGLARLIAHATARFSPRRPSLTLHRAADVMTDADALIDAACRLGFSRILTSGGAPRAIEGLARIAGMTRRADGRIAIMPGGGLSVENVATIARATGAREFHASARSARASGQAIDRLGFHASAATTDRAKVEALARTLRGAA